MAANSIILTILKPSVGRLTCLIPCRGMKYWPEVKPNLALIMPKNVEDRKLPSLSHTPQEFPSGVVMPLKYPRKEIEMRGPERIHNQLMYRQFGLIAIGGGALQPWHFDIIMDRVNQYLDFERFFAVWRVDAPYKPVSKLGQNKKLGGGKNKVHHYETPVKAGRVIIEIAGIGEYGEVVRILDYLSDRVPFYMMPISQEIMDKLEAEKREIDAKNYNPFEYRDLLRRNFSNSQLKISPKEIPWGGTFF